MNWIEPIVYGFILGSALSGVWLINASWSNFTKRMIDDHYKSQNKLVDKHHERSMELLDAWKKNSREISDAWEDHVRSVFGMEPRRRGELVELQPKKDPPGGGT